MVWKIGVLFMTIGMAILLVVVFALAKELGTTAGNWKQIFVRYESKFQMISGNIDRIGITAEEITANIKNITNIVWVLALISTSYSGIFKKNRDEIKSKFWNKKIDK
ncbi:MAG: hypothetical protein Q4A75_02040 [Peptostreptococcaceae bacterium]|nr:hypothetical protein [Peptostreptococcaceae bacterium]